MDTYYIYLSFRWKLIRLKLYKYIYSSKQILLKEINVLQAKERYRVRSGDLGRCTECRHDHCVQDC